MEEIEEVVGDKTTVEAVDLDKLTYMNQVHYLTLLVTKSTFRLVGISRNSSIVSSCTLDR